MCPITLWYVTLFPRNDSFEKLSKCVTFTEKKKNTEGEHADIYCHLSKDEVIIQTLKQNPKLQSLTDCSPR